MTDVEKSTFFHKILDKKGGSRIHSYFSRKGEARLDPKEVEKENDWETGAGDQMNVMDYDHR